MTLVSTAYISVRRSPWICTTALDMNGAASEPMSSEPKGPRMTMRSAFSSRSTPSWNSRWPKISMLPRTGVDATSSSTMAPLGTMTSSPSAGTSSRPRPNVTQVAGLDQRKRSPLKTVSGTSSSTHFSPGAQTYVFRCRLRSSDMEPQSEPWPVFTHSCGSPSTVPFV